MDIASTFQAFSGILWLAIVGLIALAVTRAGQGRPMKGIGRIVLGLGAVALVITIASLGVVTIDPNERGVVTSYLTIINPKGYRDVALQPGISFVIPIFEKVDKYSIRKQTYTMSIAPTEGQVEGDDSVFARTADGQEVRIDASVIYYADPVNVIQLHLTWQGRYQDELVRPQTRGAIRNVIAQYKIDEVVSTKRIEMIESIREEIATNFTANGLVLDDFILRNITFSDEYAKSVEQKQVAEQLALQAAFVVKQREQEAQQAIQTAKGAAESVKIAAEAQKAARILEAEGEAQARITLAQAEAEALALINAILQDNPDLLTYQYITKLSPNVQVMYLPSGGQYIIPLPTPATP